MWKQTRLLLGVQLKAAFGVNELRYGADVRKKRRIWLLLVSYALVALVMAVYPAGLAAGLLTLGLGELTAPYLFAAASLMILLFSLAKAGSLLFDLHSFEQQIVLPVRPAAIVAARFLNMYVFDAAMGALLLLPASMVYGLAVGAGGSFWVMTLLGVLLLPLLPLSIASVLGALIRAVTVRMKRRNLANIVLSVLLVLALLFGSMALSYGAEQLDVERLSELSRALSDQLGRIYPPVRLYARGVVEGSWLDFALFALLSVGVFALFVALTGRFFERICSALSASSAKGNFVLQAQKGASPLRAFYRKELRRYFASSLYVTNTAIGYLLMVILAVAVLLAGRERLQAMGLADLLGLFAPLALALPCIMSPPTTSAISLEGRQWWQAQTLPVHARTVMQSKLLVSFTVALPCYLLSELLLCIALRPGLVDCVWLLLVPAVYILFSTVMGLAINVRLPVFDWTAEATVIKQSMAVLVSMLAGFVSVLLPAAAVFLLPGWRDVLLLADCALLLALSALLYRGLCRVQLRRIQ